MNLSLMSHQRAFVELARDRPRFHVGDDCGLGKTIGMLASIEEDPARTLVVCPKSIVRSAWGGDARHFPTLRVAFLESSVRDRRAMLNAPWDVLVTNFDMFRRTEGQLAELGIRRLVVDESSKMKNHDSQITRSLIRFSDTCDRVYTMSATPAPNNNTEWWGQLRVLCDRSKMRGGLVESFYRFAHRVAVPKNKTVYTKAGPRQVVDGWSSSPEQDEWLRGVLAKCSRFLRKEDCLDLPPQVDVMHDVPLGKEADAYARVIHELAIAVGEDGGTIGVKTGAVLIKLRQIVGGSVLAGGGAVRCGDAKLDALSDLFDELGPREPCVVWFEFRSERERIAEMVKKRGESCAWIDGETSGSAADIAAAFQRGEIARLLCHPQSAGHGITLTRASHAAYFAFNFSHELHKQSRDRIHRKGMGDRCATYHYFRACLPGHFDDPRDAETVDHAMLRVWRRKADRSESVLGMVDRIVSRC